jgi:[ribosomal protein S5]-alanine N-acetyltransferase
METMPYQASLDTTPMVMPAAPAATTVTTDWRQRLPALSGSVARLRELTLSDAPSLFAMLSTEEVSRFISPPPTSVEGFERFIAWTARQRAAGEYACFAVTVQGTAIGIFQIRRLDADFSTAEWGFAIGSPFWGTGVFEDAATMILTFAFEKMGVHRLEARAALRNGRGQGALGKLGAVQEALLRKSLLRNGEYLDQVLWSIVDDDRRTCGDRHQIVH